MRRRHHTFQTSLFSFHLKQTIQSYTTLDVLFWDVPQIAAYHKKLFLARRLQIQRSAKKIRIGCTWRTAYSYLFLLAEVDVCLIARNYGRGTTFANPINAIAKSPAVISAIGTPRIAVGVSSTSRRSRIPAKRISARAKPSAVATE